MTELNKDLLESSEVYRNVAGLNCFEDSMECYTEEDYETEQEVPPLFEWELMSETERKSYINHLNSIAVDSHWVIKDGLLFEEKRLHHIDDETLPDIEF